MITKQHVSNHQIFAPIETREMREIKYESASIGLSGHDNSRSFVTMKINCGTDHFGFVAPAAQTIGNKLNVGVIGEPRQGNLFQHD